jgi:lipopolysaccharide transport system ATP-binding protein
VSAPIITIEKLSKCYLIGHQAARGDGLRHALENAFRSPQQWLRDRQQARAAQREEFWALKDVSFEVQPGEVMGIIGRNGAGKSTLLKILSRITEPTSGRITIDGRVASLLEVGTGFHAELTGRENIFLNGAILGMSKAEITRKFDEIVAFSEVEKFLDTPVKRYSSGMYVRLAFAVAAHLEPEILIVDEVLAVGDAAFQKKCLGKMQDVSKGGRTVLFVSHNIQAIKQLCTRGVYMANGQALLAGDVGEAIARYLDSKGNGTSEINLNDYARNSVSDDGRFQLIQYRNQAGQPITQCDRSQEIHARVVFNLTKPIEEFDLAMAVTHAEGIKVFSETLSDYNPKPNLAAGDYAISFVIPAKYLKMGSYSIALCALYKGRIIDFVEGLPAPEIIDAASNKDIEIHRWGLVRIPVAWLPLETL